MDDFSYYGTIAGVLLLQVSLYWLFCDDHNQRQLSSDKIKNGRLVVVLANSGHRIGAALRRRLESAGFIIYEIIFVQDQQQQPSHQITSSDRSNVIRLNSRLAAHIEQAAEFIKDQLKSKGQKLHAYISLPSSGGLDQTTTADGSSESDRLPPNGLAEVLHSIRECLVPSVALLDSLAGCPMLATGARIIRVHDSPPSPATDGGLLNGLVYLFERAINQSMRRAASLRRLGQDLIDVEVQAQPCRCYNENEDDDNDAGTSKGSCTRKRSWAMSCVPALVGTFIEHLDYIWTHSALKVPAGSACRKTTTTLDKKTVETIEALVVRINPPERRVITH